MDGIGMTSQRTRDRLVSRLRKQGIVNEVVLAQIGQLPRHIFIDEALPHRAYEDTALPIGHGQTISQPFVVALMSQLLFDTHRAKVLEVGTGCGYQTAVLANMCVEVYTIERIEVLMPKARERLRAMKLRNVTSKVGDGYEGWSRYAPFDGIIVTAAPTAIPSALLEQLNIGGRMVLPVGGDQVQQLKVIDRTTEGVVESIHEQVRFVPLVPGVGRGVG